MLFRQMALSIRQFEELNLKRCGKRVEIRVVIHGQTFERVPQLAEFIARNLTFVDQVVLMGLEIIGFTKANLTDLWIDPFDYQRQLSRAVDILEANRINVSIYNHQLSYLSENCGSTPESPLVIGKMNSCQGVILVLSVTLAGAFLRLLRLSEVIISGLSRGSLSLAVLHHATITSVIRPTVEK
jgi:hypothetical protein